MAYLLKTPYHRHETRPCHQAEAGVSGCYPTFNAGQNLVCCTGLTKHAEPLYAVMQARTGDRANQEPSHGAQECRVAPSSRFIGAAVTDALHSILVSREALSSF